MNHKIGHARTLILFILVLLSISPGVTETVANAAAKDVGGIQGRVNFCGSGGVDGMMIYIPGRQFIVVTDHTGQFLFQTLSTGSYDLNYLLGGSVVNRNLRISVRAGHILDLGEISFCPEKLPDSESGGKSGLKSDGATMTIDEKSAVPDQPCTAASRSAHCQDKDKDGVYAKNDCNDNDPDTRPGALEKCDGVDNNCNGVVDDLNDFLVPHGLGRCENGKSLIKRCDAGFSDCDGEPANGCEVDTNNDSENCGFCGNSCGDFESCQLGIC